MNRLPGILVLIGIVALVGAALIGLADATGTGGSFGRAAYVARLVWTGFVQAGLSALLSVALGAAIALALARRPAFFGRGVLVTALNVATVLPAIVTVFAVVAVLGRSGWVGDLFRAVGLDYGSWIYGLQGILFAHLFFNAPLAARVFLAALSAISPEQWRNAAQLGMPPGAIFRLIDWPVLRREAPGIAALIFLACFTSLPVVLALGGGPGNATLEVAIFEALRFEADFHAAALLALLQLGICASIVAPLVFFLSRRAPEAMSTGVSAERPDRDSRATRRIDRAVLLFSAVLVGAPLAAVAVAGGASLDALGDPAVPGALLASLAIGVPAGVLSALFALALATLGRSLRTASRRRVADGVGLVAILMLVVSPLALSAGLFVILRQWINPFSVALPLIVLVNALIALPFTYRQIEPPLLVAGERYANLADSLRLRGLSRLRIVDWPLLRGPLIVAVAMATALSLGDLGVAAFFGSSNLVTLPVLLYERLGAYRLDDAAAVALLLALLVLVLFVIAQRWSKGGWIARPR